MIQRLDGSAFGMSNHRFNFTCASAGIVAINDWPPAPGDEGVTVLEPKNKDKIEIPRQYKVIVLNDNFTPMDFVATVLSEVFKIDLDTAVTKMLEIHHQGKTSFGPYTCDIAESKAAKIVTAARGAGHPLMAQAEPS